MKQPKEKVEAVLRYKEETAKGKKARNVVFTIAMKYGLNERTVWRWIAEATRGKVTK